MSKITGQIFGEDFQLRVVSGMLVDGSIQVTWATGEPASSQMDWGLNPDELNTTPEYNSESQDMVRYHRIWFPITYLDARHYFRVRSRNKADKVEQSPIYYVITPDKVETHTNPLSSIVVLDIREVDTNELVDRISIQSNASSKSEPVSTSQKLTTELFGESFTSIEDDAETANARTNPIQTIT